jgi:hypothetical protein
MGQGRGIRPGSDLLRIMGDHVPAWLPPGFGLSRAWDDATGPWALWSDQHCRSVSVTFSHGGEAPTSWTVGYDKPHACGNSIMGMGECIGYAVSAAGGAINVQTIGLSRFNADHVVHSIQT